MSLSHSTKQACWDFDENFSFFKLIDLYKLGANYLTILWLFLPYINMNQPWVYMCPTILDPLPPPCPTHSFVLSQTTSFGCLLHASNLHWSSILHMVIYMFQCYSLISSALAFSHIAQKSVLYICVSFSVLHIGSSLQSFSIPYICVNIFCWCFSFWLTSLCIIGSSFIHFILAFLHQMHSFL